MKDIPDLTKRLHELSRGESRSANELYREIMPDLFRVAARELRKERSSAKPLEDELISEIWIHHLEKGGWEFENRQHFFALVGRTMRQVLVDFARKRNAMARGDGETPAPIETSGALSRAGIDDAHQMIEIGIILKRLEEKAPLVAEIVDLHHICGYTLPEIAKIKGLSLKQVRTGWEEGKKQLKRALLAGRRQEI